jgi:hypothetical protein
MKCWNKIEDNVQYWNWLDEERWKFGQLICKGRINCNCTSYIFTKDNPPKECLYRLEYLLKEKEQDV